MRTVLWSVLLLVAALTGPVFGQADDVRGSVVKLYATYRGPDFASPWSKLPPQEFTGSGFVISEDLILTNAHVVEQSSQIFVQPPQSSDRLRAELVAIGRGIDLALVRIRRDAEREEFHSQHPPLPLREELPRVGGTVQAFGYPMGGEQLSITEGVVSRIEYADYYFDTFGLRVQVDAALNPGNSGGPVVMDGEVIGVTFSGIDQAENIGYVIPAEEVRAFLEDVEDGSYDGRLKLFIDGFQTAENDALRDWLGLDKSQTGLVFSALSTGRQNPDTELERWDLLDRIGEHDIDNSGLVTIGDGVRVNWAYLIPKVAQDGQIPVTVIREGQQVELSLPVSVKRDTLLSYLGNEYPEYFVLGPMVFTPATRDHLFEYYRPYLAMTGSPISLRSEDLKAFEGEELVVLASEFLPHPITKGYEITYRPTIKSVNGTTIKNLSHMLEVIKASDDEYLMFEFYDEGQETLVFDRESLLETTEEVLEDNSIRRQGSDRFMDIWED